MNAVIALNHFCESHGPCVIFTTQTLRETKVEEISFSNVSSALFDRHLCPSCNSIGLHQGYVSKDPETETNFFSSQWPAIPETANVLKVAATRSLSCETSYNKNGGFVFFGDSSGHVLSHTFHVSDSNARGFFKLFSITILMKDKTFLLNTEPFLSQHLENISHELQEYAKKVYKDDQIADGSQRAARLNAGQITSNTARSLMELTGEEHIYGILHSHFAWLLWAGARYLSESITLGTPSIPPWLGHEIEEGFTMVHIDKEDYLMKKVPKWPSSSISLRDFRSLDRFSEILQAIVTGQQVVLRGDDDQSYARCLCTVLPDNMQGVVGRSEFYVEEYKILSLPSLAEVPEEVIRIDIAGQILDVVGDTNVLVRLPTFVAKILKAVDEAAFTEEVLQKRVKVLVEEWKTKIQCLQKVRTVDNTKIKKVLGIQTHDMPLANYWTTYLR